MTTKLLTRKDVDKINPDTAYYAYTPGRNGNLCGIVSGATVLTMIANGSKCTYTVEAETR